MRSTAIVMPALDTGKFLLSHDVSLQCAELVSVNRQLESMYMNEIPEDPVKQIAIQIAGPASGNQPKKWTD